MLEVEHNFESTIQKQFRIMIPAQLRKPNDIRIGDKVVWEKDLSKYIKIVNGRLGTTFPEKSILLIFEE